MSTTVPGVGSTSTTTTPGAATDVERPAAFTAMADTKIVWWCCRDRPRAHSTVSVESAVPVAGAGSADTCIGAHTLQSPAAVPPHSSKWSMPDSASKAPSTATQSSALEAVNG